MLIIILVVSFLCKAFLQKSTSIHPQETSALYKAKIFELLFLSLTFNFKVFFEVFLMLPKSITLGFTSKTAWRSSCLRKASLFNELLLFLLHEINITVEKTKNTKVKCFIASVFAKILFIFHLSKFPGAFFCILTSFGALIFQIVINSIYITNCFYWKFILTNFKRIIINMNIVPNIV